MEGKIIFLINSAIWLINKPFSYAAHRSVFSPEKRVEQTLKTIDSIREKVPKAKIICFESGLKRDLTEGLRESCDEFYYLGGHAFVRLASDSKFKGFGEAVTFLSGFRFIKNQGDFYFKLSGRYFLNEEFDLSHWDEYKFNLLKIGPTMSTRLYGFSAKCLPLWRRALVLSLPLLLANRSMEWCMPRFISKSKINYMQGSIGVMGSVGPDGNPIRE